MAIPILILPLAPIMYLVARSAASCVSRRSRLGEWWFLVSNSEMYCANHPNVETELTCGRCDKPVCTRCIVHTEVGIRCRQCCGDRQGSDYQDRRHVRLGALLGLGAIGLLVFAVVVPPVLGLKPDIPSSDLRETSDLYESSDEPADVAMPTSPPPAPGESYDVLIVSANCSIDHEMSWASCSGSVKNLLPHNLQEVEVVVALLSDDGTPQASTDGPIDYDPLLPDQLSPWTVFAPYNPAFSKYSVSFRTASGQPLRAGNETP